MNQIVLAAESGDIGGCPAHIKADHRLSCVFVICGHGIAHHSARGTGKNGPAPGEVIGLCQSAVRLHEQQARISQAIAESPAKAVQIVPNMRCQICVNHSCVAPGHQFDHGHDLGRERDLGKSDLTRQTARDLFMFRPGIRVHKTIARLRIPLSNTASS